MGWDVKTEGAKAEEIEAENSPAALAVGSSDG